MHLSRKQMCTGQRNRVSSSMGSARSSLSLLSCRPIGSAWLASVKVAAQESEESLPRDWTCQEGNNYEQRLQLVYQPLFHVAQAVLPRTAELLDEALARLNGESTIVDVKVLGLYRELVYWHSVTNHVCGTARRRVIDREQVPNCDKLFSLFEPDTELIMRGKAGQPIQFGHVVLVMKMPSDSFAIIKYYPSRATNVMCSCLKCRPYKRA